MTVSAESVGFIVLMVRFILPYFLGAGKSSLHRTKSETQKNHLTVKTTEKRNISLLPLELGVVFQS